MTLDDLIEETWDRAVNANDDYDGEYYRGLLDTLEKLKIEPIKTHEHKIVFPKLLFTKNGKKLTEEEIKDVVEIVGRTIKDSGVELNDFR